MERLALSRAAEDTHFGRTGSCHQRNCIILDNWLGVINIVLESSGMNKFFSWLKQLAQGRTLASQILLYFLVAAFIVTVAVGSFTYFTLRHRLKEQLTGRFSDDARLMATYIAQTIATGYYDIQLLSYNSVIASQTASLSDKLMEMEKTQWLHGLFEDITLLD